MKKNLLIFLLPFAVFLFPSLVSAQSRLTYPIPELGYCRDAKECSLYCEIPQNKATCWSYGKYKLESNVLGVTTISVEEKQMMETKAKEYNITFPIVDLGNCAGPQECRDFCEESSNQTTCMDFAKKKGFQKEVGRPDGMDPKKRTELMEKAKTELGCTSMDSCKNICETDQTRCEAFAKKNGIYQGPPSQEKERYNPQEKMKLIDNAKVELGCTSMESCKSVCEQNPERCMNFAKKHGFDRPELPERREKQEENDEMNGPEEMEIESRKKEFMAGKCDSDDSCKKYCQENPDECPGFRGNDRNSIQQPSSGVQSIGGMKNYVGPSGCRTEAECKNWCTDHPEKCPGFTEGKIREESSKREYELKKKQIEQNQETQKRQFETNREMMQQNYEYRPPSGGSPSYPSTSTQPAYTGTSPSQGTYTPPSTQPAAP
ncbi:MAG: hypothetical protein Q8L37_02490 [Candidatus Gottesmanbacteria bacterium]|nr:hypothetical protein [Candidatus Gottesmanbacteria bacterium]